MGYYNYKQAVNRPDFDAAEKEWEEQTGNKSDGDPGYDGSYWSIAAWMLDKKDKRITELEAQLAEAQKGAES